MDTPTKTTTTGQNGTPLSPAELHEALFKALDIMERAMLPFMLLKETALQCKESQQSLEPDLELRQIDFGVRAPELTKEVLSVLQTYAENYRNDGTDISFTVGRVPVVVRIIHRNYGVFKNPDTVFYKIEQFKIPNPFNKYWEMRGFIR